MSTLNFLLASDNDGRTEWRDILLGTFFEDIAESGLRRLSPKYTEKRYCHKWYGLQCDKQTKELMEVCLESFKDRFSYGNFNLDFLPHSVITLYITSSLQTSEFRIRRLPRSLIRLQLNDNMLSGSLELTALPLLVEIVNLSRNFLTGPLSLLYLPKNLRLLYLQSNRVRQHTVFYGEIPKSTSVIHLVSQSTDEIRAVRAIHPRSAVVDKNIFVGVKRIH
mmetsp:Transcript_1965/g.3037  ORF Transcript_1965/g.3037 Transcript_1965/m.3037 type:complete len:221 (-) Transcript_1965:48-710(-)